MLMIRFGCAALLFLAMGARAAAPQDIERRVEDLLGRMTLEEKFGQLQQISGVDNAVSTEVFRLAREGRLGSISNFTGAENANKAQREAVEHSRLKIPLIFGFDVRHGYRTIFPIPLGEAASWDPAAAERGTTVAAAESAAGGVKWTFAPMLDLVRDPRWGRVAEVSGEDPYLGAAMGAARVRGFQGTDYSALDRIVACAVIWVGYGAAEGGRDYNTTEISLPTLRDMYFPPFRAAQKAGVGTFMSAFNDLNGIPSSANRFTLTDVLRTEWGFDGFVVSDWEAVRELQIHGIAADAASAVSLALNAGVDMEMESRLYAAHGAKLVGEGRVPLAVVDEAVRRVLRVKFRAGLFERPYADPAREKSELLKPANLAAAREIAARSLVLLKNERGTLPLRKNLKTLAVVGALADSGKDQLGSWSGNGVAAETVTILAALRSRRTGAATLFEGACGPVKCGKRDIDAAVKAVERADAAVIVVGETAEMSGEAHSRSELDLPGRQLELVKAVHKTGKPYVVVLMNGRPMTLAWIAEHSPALLVAWQGGTQGGPAVADALFGDVNPGGKLPMTFPRSVGQVPIYYNHKNSGRPDTGSGGFSSRYIDLPSSPQYPFGYGLSYTRFELSSLRLSAAAIPPSGSLVASVEVRNTGDRDGDEVVQLYVRDLAGSLTRPVRELKGFERVTLKSGESRRLSFRLGPEELGFTTASGRFEVEPGQFQVFAATSSVGGLMAEFEVAAPR